MSYRDNSGTSQIVAAAQSSGGSDSAIPSGYKVSVDQLTAANVATSVAETTDLPVAGNLREATTTLYIQKQLSQSDNTVISKPQFVQPQSATERGYFTYKAKQGDTVPKVADANGISSQTLRWANDLTSDTLKKGQSLIVPRVDGVVYTTKSGDTVQKLASKYRADAQRIALYNDLLESDTLKSGERIVIPGGVLPSGERPGASSTTSGSSTTSSSGSYGGGGQITDQQFGMARASVGNRYAAGNCTWYAYERRAELGRPIGSFWGNAYSWETSARAAGFKVNKTPAPGAVFQTSAGGGGYGHAGIVERIEGGKMYVSDMNYAGYNIITKRVIPMSQAGMYNYIH